VQVIKYIMITTTFSLFLKNTKNIKNKTVIFTRKKAVVMRVT